MFLQKQFEKYDFELSNIFDYVKVGVEAIIEDQVTSRFEAEELKNWNLLIRTNTSYEFISWRLTVIWLCGFFIRYFFLFPIRVLICFFGVSIGFDQEFCKLPLLVNDQIAWLLVSTFLVGTLPEGTQKRWIVKKAYITSFRVMARCLSAVIRIHNKEFRPKTGGVCVANHTSPVDVLILSTDNNYSLVSLFVSCQRAKKMMGVLCFFFVCSCFCL